MSARTQARPIIIRRHDADVDHDHHGGAWKVAYADFMTAMMAFFLLMWIVASASKEQIKGISEYFAPATVSMTAKGGIGAMGGTSFGPKGVLHLSNGKAAPKGMASTDTNSKPSLSLPQPRTTDKTAPAAAASPHPSVTTAPAKASTSDTKAKDSKNSAAAGPVRTIVKVIDRHAADEARFQAVQQEVTKAMAAVPDLKPLLKNVMFEKTKDGLNIQILDQHGKAMFARGSAKVEGPTLVLMQRLGRAIAGLPNKIRIAGHTDATPYADGAGSDNWALSSERANATRRVFMAAGVQPGRITQISGLADTDPLVPDAPRDPRNRRITVLLAYQPDAMGPVLPTKNAATAKDLALTPAAAHAGSALVPAASSGPTTTSAATQASAASGPLQRTYAMVTLADLSRQNN